MRSLRLTPSPFSRDVIVDSADWVETETLFKADASVSQEDLSRALVRRSSLSIESARQIAEDAFNELADRQISCGPAITGNSFYPFELSSDQFVLRIRKSANPESSIGTLYFFLLFITRADMSSDERTLHGIDPTKVFESVGGDVLRSFWGGQTDFSDAMIWGTSAYGGSNKAKFRKRMADLCARIGEGVGMRDDAAPPGGGDAGIDIVVWRKFADRRQGALIGLAQCKTGIHWRQHLPHLRPESFSQNYLQQPLLFPPVRLYLVPNRIFERQWRKHSLDGGLLLDRCRIMQYGERVSSHTLKHCRKWVTAAYKRQRAGRVSI